MEWLSGLAWLLKCCLTCNHLRTPVSEGKCYCPDCGQGLIYRWIILRCTECNLRRDSRYFLRQAVPAERCCLHCGSTAIRWDYLETPSYYQIHKARLIVQEAQEYERQQAFAWTVCELTRATEEALHKTRSWLAGQVAPKPALLPVLVER